MEKGDGKKIALITGITGQVSKIIINSKITFFVMIFK